MNQSVLKATSPNFPQTFARGERLQDRYVIVRPLGAGGMGAVYEAIDERLQVTVAIKETFAVEARLRRQFEQEARLLAQLSHPALPRVSDYFTEDERSFLVMQFIAGDDLARAIAERSGPFPRAQVIAWADQLLDALIYLHTRERQIIHRDIKPHNLKISATGQIALLDFGLAKTHTGDQSTTNTSHSIFGYTRRYSPLEQIQDQGTSPQSDIYALGATLYHLLTGTKPPDALARAAALANSKPDPLISAHQAYPVVGPELSAVLNKALSLNSTGRFQTALEFREALRSIGRSELRMANCTDLSTTPRGPSIFDPFDSYSILKPPENAWPSPGKSWPIGATVTAVAILLVGMAVSFPLWPRDKSIKSIGDYAGAPAVTNTSVVAAHDSKSDRVRGNSSVAMSGALDKDRARPIDKPKRPNRRTTNTPANPPAPSLREALRVTSQ